MKAAVTRSGRPPGYYYHLSTVQVSTGRGRGVTKLSQLCLAQQHWGTVASIGRAVVAISTISDFAWLSASSSLLHERGVQNSSLAGCIKHVVACAGSNGHRRMKVARRVSGFLSAFSMCGRVLSVQGEHYYRPVQRRCKVVELLQWRKQLVQGRNLSGRFLS